MKEKLNDVLNNVAGTLPTHSAYIYIYSFFFFLKKGLTYTNLELDSS